jgi:hypothetical protein
MNDLYCVPGPYSKTNRLNDFLNHLTVKEEPNIPRPIMTQIQDIITNKYELENLTCHDVSKILRKLNLRKYQEHYIYMFCKIKCIEYPKLNDEQKTNILNKFTDVIKVYDECKINKKLREFPMAYIIKKICEMLRYYHISELISDCAASQRSTRYYLTWCNICHKLGWNDISSGELLFCSAVLGSEHSLKF